MGLNTINDDFGGKKGVETTDNNKGHKLVEANVTAPGNSAQGDSAQGNWVEASNLRKEDAEAVAGKILEGTNGSSTPETGNDNGTPSEGETLETAKEKTSFELLVNVEKMVQEHKDSSDPTIIAIIKDYEDTKRSMNNLLSDSAKQALKQAGIHLDVDDDNNNSIEETPGDRSGDTVKTLEDEYPSPKDAEKVKEILGNKRRVNDVIEVMENQGKLTEEQKKVLNAELDVFKKSLEYIALKFNVHDWIAAAGASGKTPDTDPGNETPDTDSGVDNSSTPEDIQGGEGGRVEM